MKLETKYGQYRISYPLQVESVIQSNKVPQGTVSAQSHALGISEGEPLFVAMDALIRYAKAYRARFDGNLSEDGVLGEPWLDAAKGIRSLLNGDGAVAMESDRTTDSKDNGAIEGMFWDALKVAGFEESDL